MNLRSAVAWMLEQETQALLTRVARFSRSPSRRRWSRRRRCARGPGRDRVVSDRGRRELIARSRAIGAGCAARACASPVEMQRRFVIIRLRFHGLLSQFETFTNAITQRSEAETGVWLSGLDAVAADALRCPAILRAPPVICYLDRGPGAAIRRARTRLPAASARRSRSSGSAGADDRSRDRVLARARGGPSGRGAARPRPVAAAGASGARRARPAGDAELWRTWERWISEIVADLGRSRESGSPRPRG